jgi:hypothetical protein
MAMGTVDGQRQVRVQSELDTALWEMVNRFLGRAGPYTTGLVLIALVVGATSSAVAEVPPVRVLMPGLSLPFVILSWWLARRRQIGRRWAWTLVMGIGGVPLAVVVASLLVSSEGPASLWLSPMGWSQAGMIAASVIFLDRYLPVVLACFVSVQTVILYVLAGPGLAELTGGPLVLEMVSSGPMVGVRCGMYLALGILMAVCAGAFRELVAQVVTDEADARAASPGL